MKNSLASEIARETRRVAPLKSELEGIKPGDTVYVFREGRLPAAALVDRVNAAFAFSSDSNLRIRISDGVVDPCAHGKPCFARFQVSDPEVRAAFELDVLERELRRTLVDFWAVPRTKEKVMEVLAVLNPNAWRIA